MTAILFLLLVVLLFGREFVLSMFGWVFWIIVFIIVVLVILYLFAKGTVKTYKILDSHGIIKFVRDCNLTQENYGWFGATFIVYLFIIPQVYFLKDLGNGFLNLLLIIIASLLTWRIIAFVKNKLKNNK